MHEIKTLTIKKSRPKNVNKLRILRLATQPCIVVIREQKELSHYSNTSCTQ